MIQPQALMAEVEDALVPQLPIPVLRRLFERVDDDSWVAFGSRRETKHDGVAPHWLYAVQKRELERWLPPVLQHAVEQTQYIGQNPVGRQALRHWSRNPDSAPERDPDDYRQAILTGKPIYFQAFDRRVKELSGIVLDLDCYKIAGLTAELGLGLVLEMVREHGTLPQPSFAALSGRGLYLWWLLRDAKGKAPKAADPENLHQWRMVLDELWRRTQRLGSDPKAKRLLQWFKAPGTTDTKTEKKVLYMTFGTGPLATVPEYMLPELVTELGLTLASATAEAVPELHDTFGPEPATDRTGPGWQPGMAGNPSAVHRARIRDLELLAGHRDGIREGHRRSTLVCFYRSRQMTYRVFKLGVAADARAQADTRAFAASWCRPRLPDGDVSRVFDSWRKGVGYRPKTTTLVDHLGITDAECRDLNLTTLVTETVKAEREQDKIAGKAGVTDLELEIEKLLLPPYSMAKRPIKKALPLASYGRISRARDRLVAAGLLDQDSDPGQGELDV